MTPAKANPPAPGHLSNRSKSFWRRVQSEFELETGHLELLLRCCETMDRCDQARAVLDEEGLTFVDKSGAIKPHPAAAIEVSNRLQVLRLLQALKLGEGDLQSASQPARQLARKRWNQA
jgi:P27 family predicted phage terminase small subunit